jgi:hypothetical protein
MDERARLTLPDLGYIAFALAGFAALWPVFWSGLNDAAADLGTGEVYLLRLTGPLLVVVIFALLWRKTIRGAGQ